MDSSAASMQSQEKHHYQHLHMSPQHDQQQRLHALQLPMHPSLMQQSLRQPTHQQVLRRPQHHRCSLGSYSDTSERSPQPRPLPFVGAPVPQGMRQTAESSSCRSAMVTKPIAQHAPPQPMLHPSTFSVQRDQSSMSRSSSVSSTMSTSMEMALASRLNLNDHPTGAGSGFAPPSFRNVRRVSATPSYNMHGVNAFVLPQNIPMVVQYQQMQQQPSLVGNFDMHHNGNGSQGNLSMTLGNQNSVQNNVPMGSPRRSFSNDQLPKNRVILAVADLLNYGKAKRRTSSGMSTMTKKRKRSANISELSFSRLHKPNQPPYNLIRVWVNERSMQFYDCACGRRKAVQDLQKIVRHVEKCYFKRNSSVDGMGQKQGDTSAEAGAESSCDASASEAASTSEPAFGEHRKSGPLSPPKDQLLMDCTSSMETLEEKA